MTGSQNFTDRERERFRKLLEVANSTTYQGEKDAALAAATRLARSHGMSLREAAGIREEAPLPQRKTALGRNHRTRKRPSSDPKFGDTFRASRETYNNETEYLKREKQRYEKAMADAIRRGLQFDEEQAAAKRRPNVRRSSKGGWRARPDFIRVLLRETRMNAREIAATVGVSVHDVFKEKLLMRQA